jgi:hypothetical protein
MVLRYHIPPNCVITSDSLNRIKGTHGPAVLPAISQFRNATTQEELLNSFNGLLNIYVNNKELKLQLRHRITEGEQMSRERVEAIQKAFKTGELLTERYFPENKLFEVLNCPSAGHRHSVSWRPASHEYRWSQFKQIPALYGFDSEKDVRLWTIEDDEGNLVFYPFSPFTKTFVRWNTWINECWFQERWERMRDFCNEYWITDCTPEELMMETLHCRMKRLRDDREELEGDMVGLHRLTLMTVQNTYRYQGKARFFGSSQRSSCPGYVWPRCMALATLCLHCINRQKTPWTSDDNIVHDCASREPDQRPRSIQV